MDNCPKMTQALSGSAMLRKRSSACRQRCRSDEVDVDLRQIRTFVHVAELGSISAAAERLHVAQPALSRQLQSLEQELGVRLFQRHGRGMALTEAGSLVLARSTGLLNGLEEMREELRHNAGAPSGEVSFALPPSVADGLSVPLVERFSSRFPQVKLSISTGYSGYVLDWLLRGQVDVAVLYDTATSPTLRSRRLMLERLYLIEADENAEAAPVPVAELSLRRLILPRPQHGLRRLLDAVATQQGVVLDPVIEADSLPLQLELVRRGFGATVLPAMAVGQDLRRGGFSIRELCEPEVTRQLVLATPLDRPMRPAVRHFADAVEQTVLQLAETGGWPGTAPNSSTPPGLIAMPVRHS